MIIKTQTLKVSGTDYTSAVKSVVLNYNSRMVDGTVMGNDTVVNTPSVYEWSITAELKDDFTDNGLDEVLFGLVGAAAFAVETKPTNAATGAGNPRYYGNAVLQGVNIGGAWGELGKKSVTFLCAGTLTRAVAD